MRSLLSVLPPNFPQFTYILYKRMISHHPPCLNTRLLLWFSRNKWTPQHCSGHHGNQHHITPGCVPKTDKIFKEACCSSLNKCALNKYTNSFLPSLAINKFQADEGLLQMSWTSRCLNATQYSYSYVLRKWLRHTFISGAQDHSGKCEKVLIWLHYSFRWMLN